MRCSSARPSRRTSRSDATARPRCSTSTAGWSPRPSTSPCTSARCPRPWPRSRARDPAPGEPWILNDPYTGGTHLPDLTIVTRTDLGFAVSRAHHADVGGTEPGSLPAGSRTLEEEGVVVPPTRLDDAALEGLVSRMRNPDERRGDLRAQLAAHRLADRRIAELAARRGRTPGQRRDAGAPRVLGACRPRRDSRASGRALGGGGHARDGDGPSRDPRGRDDRGRRDRDRLLRDCTAARREPELPARGHPLRVLLRRAPADGARPARLRRSLRSGDGARPRRVPRERPASRGRRGGKHGDVEQDRGRRAGGARTSDPRSRAGSGDDEQRRPRQRRGSRTTRRSAEARAPAPRRTARPVSTSRCRTR